MKRIIFNSIFLTLCFSCAVYNVFAQQTEQERQMLSQIKIESFDWYAASEVAEPSAINLIYKRGLPEGRSANLPEQNPAPPQKSSEKFIYWIKIRNSSEKEITAVSWRYEFYNPLTKELTSSFKFESRVRIKPNKRKTLYAESFSPPTQTIDVNLLLLNKKQPYLESAAITALNFKEKEEK